MIHLEGVSKVYGDVVAVDDLSLSVAAGELMVLIGPSGCGKTTTLRMINRLIEPTRGAIYVGGRDTSREDPALLRRSIGYVIQSVGLFPHMTVAQNIQVVPELLRWPRTQSARRADELLDLVGLDPASYRDKYPAELSGGQAQRVGVARALAVDPPVLLMDEPFGAVDPLTRERLQDIFIKLQQRLNKTVVMVTHDIDEAIKLADRICLMRFGRIEQVSTPEELLAAPKNRFVRTFVGTDRALKRLTRVPIEPLVQSAPSVDIHAESSEVLATLAQHRTAYVTRSGRLVGWIDRQSIAARHDVAEAVTDVDPEHAAIFLGSSAKEALSRMLAQGASELPVVDLEGVLVGRLDLGSIVALTSDPNEQLPGR